MDLKELTEKVASVIAGSGFDNTVKFDFGALGQLFIDGVNGTATNDDGEADATVTLDFEDFKALAKGDMDPMMAFMQGKLQVAGDMGVAMKLQSLFKALT